MIPKIQYEPHNSENGLYVSATQRICVTCPDGANIIQLASFIRNGSGDYSTQCRRCVLHEGDVVTVATVSEVGKAMQRTAIQSGAATSYAELLQATCRPMGGTRKAMGRIGRVFNKAMNQSLKKDATKHDIELGVKVGSILLGSAAVQEKNSKPADPSTYSEEFIIDQCIDLLITNPGMRQRVLNDPQVRRVILRDLGVSVVDGRKVNTDGIEDYTATSQGNAVRPEVGEDGSGDVPAN